MKKFFLSVLNVLSFIGGIIWVGIQTILGVIGTVGLYIVAFLLMIWLLGFLLSGIFGKGFAYAWSNNWWMLLILIGAAVICVVLRIIGESSLDNSKESKDSDHQGSENGGNALTTEPDEKEKRIANAWNESIVQEVVNEVADYAVKLGEPIDRSKEIATSSYPPPITTKMYMPPEAKRKLKEQIYNAHNAAVASSGNLPAEFSVNVRALSYVDENQNTYWEFYILL